jgi:hypothetical protein
VDPFFDPGTCRQIPEFHMKVSREPKSLFGVPKIVFTTRSLLDDAKPVVTKAAAMTAAAMTAAAVTRTGSNARAVCADSYLKSSICRHNY